VSRAYLVQEGAVADLLPKAEYHHGGACGEHGGAGIPEKRALRPHGSTNASPAQLANESSRVKCFLFTDLWLLQEDGDSCIINTLSPVYYHIKLNYTSTTKCIVTP
jgi:hypothetical protein